jgi:hypothetical protein
MVPCQQLLLPMCNTTLRRGTKTVPQLVGLLTPGSTLALPMPLKSDGVPQMPLRSFGNRKRLIQNGWAEITSPILLDLCYSIAYP